MDSVNTDDSLLKTPTSSLPFRERLRQRVSEERNRAIRSLVKSNELELILNKDTLTYEEVERMMNTIYMG